MVKKYGTSTYLQSIIWREDTDQFLQDQNFNKILLRPVWYISKRKKKASVREVKLGIEKCYLIFEANFHKNDSSCKNNLILKYAKYSETCL